MNWPMSTIDALKAKERYSLIGGPFGSNLTTRDYVEDGVPVIRGANLPDDRTFHDDDFVFVSEEKADQLSSNLSFAGDLIITQRGTLGQVGIIPQGCRYERYVLSQSQMKLKVDADIADSTYVYYFFRQPETVQYIRNFDSSSGVPHINLGVLKAMRIPLPPLASQRRIVKTVSAYDDLIDNNRRRIKLLEDSVRLLFDQWFVRRRPSAGAVGGQDYPADWRSVRASEIIDINPTTRRKDNGSLCYVPMAALSTAGTTVDRSQLERREASTSVRFIRGDTLFARITPCLENGKTALAYFLDPGEVACGSTEFIVLRGRAVGPAFTYCLARNEMFRENAIKSMIGSSGRQRVQPSAFDKFELMLAPQHVIVQFEAMAKDCFDQIALLVRQCDRLVEARNLLLPRLMSGELTV
jgi:type I restriction enzyme S subunit